MCSWYFDLTLKCWFWWPTISTAVFFLFFILSLEFQISSWMVSPTLSIWQAGLSNPFDQMAYIHNLPVVPQLIQSFYENAITFGLLPFSLCLNRWGEKGVVHQAIFASRSWKMYKWVILNMHALMCSWMKPEGTTPHQQRANAVPKQPSMYWVVVRQGRV